ncbi:MAG TPA: hypothetical protein VIM71_16025 [Lacunisphaera sp.]
MTITEYLDGTRHAASTLINAFTFEWKAHNDAAVVYNQTIDEFDALGAIPPLDPDHFAEHARFAEAFQKSREKYVQMRMVQEDRFEKIQSTAILCGALLQLAKQGLASVHGSKANIPIGRVIGGTNLRNVIWEGRNQTMHFEEFPGKPYNPSVTACFQALEAGYGAKFALGAKNLSVEIIDLLDWRTLQKYENDMSSLA